MTFMVLLPMIIGPIISLIIGLCVSIFQTVTSIQEQTLTFVPKLIGIFLAIILLDDFRFSEKEAELVAQPCKAVQLRLGLFRFGRKRV